MNIPSRKQTVKLRNFTWELGTPRSEAANLATPTTRTRIRNPRSNRAYSAKLLPKILMEELYNGMGETPA